jgi:Fic family protein
LEARLIKIPEKAPDFSQITPEDFGRVFALMENEELRNLIRRANKNYLYWDKFKYRIPENLLNHRLAWFLLKLSRKNQLRFISSKDKESNPFNFWLPDQVQEDLHYLDSVAGGHISFGEPIINKDSQERYLVHSLMEEAISSSLLEGAATTREKARDMLLSGKKAESHADKMILNNYRTIRKLSSIKDEALSHELLNEIHETITQGTLKKADASGRFRNESDDPIDVIDEQGNTLFVPPLVGEIGERVDELIQFANADDEPGEFIHPIIKGVILHFLLGYIHPFVDGNGRTARAIFYWYMLKRGYWLIEYIPISRIFLKSPAQYTRAYLYSEIDDQDLTYFIVYNLKALRLGFRELKAYIARKQKKVKMMGDVFRGNPDLNARQTVLIQHALKHPGMEYNIQNHKNYYGVTYETARTDLLDLVERNFMEKIKRGNKFFFKLSKEIDKFLEK